jgi:phosphatidylglycerophosphate synthase
MSEGSESPAGSLLTIGNALTGARLILLPLVIVGIATHRGHLAVVAMAAIVVTDLLDGRIARRLGQASEFGKTLDSTIDFVLIYSLFIAFYAAGRLATFQFAILYLAMLTILLLQLVVAGTGRGAALGRTALGKLTGALEYGYLLFLVAMEVLPRRPGLTAAGIAFFVVLALAIVLNSIECLVKLRRLA